MKVDWHEVPGRVVDLVRPVGHGMIGSGPMALLSKNGVHTSAQKPSRQARQVLILSPNLDSHRGQASYRTLRDGFLSGPFPGTTCQATFIKSLRDKSATRPGRTG
jgi:hypothetical protein